MSLTDPLWKALSQTLRQRPVSFFYSSLDFEDRSPVEVWSPLHISLPVQQVQSPPSEISPTMRLSCILLVASVALFTAGNALPASTNPDQIAVAKVDVPNDNRFLRSVDTDADEDDSVDVQDDADEDDSSEDQDEERMFNAISVMMGLKTADDVAAEVAKAAVKVSNNEFLQNLLKVDFRKKTFTRWKDTEHMFPEQAKRFMEMFTTEKRFMNIVTQYEDFFNGVLKLDDIV